MWGEKEVESTVGRSGAVDRMLGRLAKRVMERKRGMTRRIHSKNIGRIWVEESRSKCWSGVQ